MRPIRKYAFTLVELLVVIAIIGTLVALLLPAVQAAREAARNNTCKNNLTQFVKALASRESSVGDLPGYINKIGINGAPAAQQQRASWVVMTFPYMEANALWDRWSLGFQDGSVVSDYFAELEILNCPSDPQVTPGIPSLSYCANAGFAQNESAPGGHHHHYQENPANGVFFDRTRVISNPLKSSAGPADCRDMPGPDPEIVMTIAYLQAKGDGTTHTMMLSENMNAVHWGYSTEADRNSTPDKKYHFGFMWEQPKLVVDALQGASANADPKTGLQFRRINGQRESDSYDSVGEMLINDGFPSSNHNGLVNVAFVGGQVVGIVDQIDLVVYAQLMTSNHKKSDLVNAAGTISDRDLTQPSDNDY
ncbi:MAG: DUF1559 domain-containing protein [Pirellulales bacterium]|nr:DUF1559 domain-containing protein [Pirellulales bacterium]